MSNSLKNASIEKIQTAVAQCLSELAGRKFNASLLEIQFDESTNSQLTGRESVTIKIALTSVPTKVGLSEEDFAPDDET